MVIALILFGINALYLPVHMIMDHHEHDQLDEHEHHVFEHHHDNMDHGRLNGHDAHDDADHDLPSSRPLASVIAPVSISLAVIFILPPPCLVTQAVETHWYPTCIDSDRAPPGPSRAPPV